MSEVNTDAEFLQKQYQLNTNSGVVSTARRYEQQTREIVKKGDFQTRIQNYLDRLHSIIDPPVLEGGNDYFDRRKRNLSMIKNALHNHFVTTPEDIPESYYDSIKRRRREEGYGDETSEDYRQEFTQAVIKDQKNSLDNWIDYLASDEAKYPDWLKYFAFRSVLRMGNYDKDREVFNERTRKGRKTIAPFPELNREALAIILGDLERRYSAEKDLPDSRNDLEFSSRFDIADEVKERYRIALENKNFSALYSLSIEEFKPIAEELLKTTTGKWIEYPSGSDPKKLVSSIKDYGTRWCLREEAEAGRYLKDNNLHVYYSQDQEGSFAVPRVVMVVNQSGSLTAVRGVAKNEHLDSYIGMVVETKLSEPEFEKEGRAYKKRSDDMKILTDIDNRVKKGEELTGENLIFLYERDTPIEGFGYRKDSRIAELRSKRNPQEDMPIVFGCSKEQIAQQVGEIRSDTKAYVGSLEKGKLDKLRNIEYVYTSFPEDKIQIEDLEIGGKDAQHLKAEVENNNIQISQYAADQMESFTTLKNPETITTVKLRLKDLGLIRESSTTDQVYARVDEFGLDLCFQEVGVYRKLKDERQLLKEYYWVGVKQITGRPDKPFGFSLENVKDGKKLLNLWTQPNGKWFPEDRFVFTLRSSAT